MHVNLSKKTFSALAKKVHFVTAVKFTLHSSNAHLSRDHNMAALASVSVEEALEEVWNVEEMDEEIEVLPLEDVLKMCMDNFNCLQQSKCNYTSFQEDVKGMLWKVYWRHKMGVNATNKVLMSYVPVSPMVSEVCVWLKSIHRRLLVNPRAANLWSIEVRRDLIEEIFLHIRQSIQEGVSAFGDGRK